MKSPTKLQKCFETENFPYFSLSASLSVLLSPPPHVGDSSSSKKTKNKSSISRSQSQRPTEKRDLLTVSHVSPVDQKNDAGTGTQLSSDSVPDPQSQPKPASEANVTNPPNTGSGPTTASEDVSPSAGSSSALLPETCDTEEGAEMTPEETSPPPLRQEEDGGLESRPVSEPNEGALNSHR